MKKLSTLALLVAISLGVSYAQTTTVSATVVDSDSTVWANGTWKIEWSPGPNASSINAYTNNGSKLSQSVAYQNGTLDGSGAMSVTVYDSSVTFPTGSGWVLTLCSNTSAQCSFYNFSTAGASQNISAALTASIAAPRFKAISGTYGYADVEATLTIATGATYWNVVSHVQRTWNGSAWVATGGTGSGTVNPGQRALAQYPSSTAATVNPSNITYDIATGNNITVPQSVAVGSTIPTKNADGEGINIMAPPFNAKCDDTTDDTTAIQTAQNSLCSGSTQGGKIKFPYGLACRTTAAINVTCGDVIFEGGASRQFITANGPPTYIDFQGTNANAVNVSNQGFIMRDMGVKYPPNTGGPLSASGTMTSSTATVGGTIADSITIFAEYNCVNALGQSLYSSEVSQTTGSSGSNTNTVTFTLPASPCTGTAAVATGWNLGASANSHNETIQNVTVTPIGTTSFTMTAGAVNNGNRNLVDTSAACAISDNNAGNYHHVSLFTGLSAAPYGIANGLCLSGSSAKVDMVSSVVGFNIGFALLGRNNNVVIADDVVQANTLGMQVGGGAHIVIRDDDFEANLNGNVQILSGQVAISDYKEQQLQGGTTAYEVQYGAAPGTPANEVLSNNLITSIPVNNSIRDSFLQCNAVTAVDPILIYQVAGLVFENNQFANCGSVTNVVNNTYANAAANITFDRNQSDAASTSWTSSTTGFRDYDFSNTTRQALGTKTFSSIALGSPLATSSGGTGNTTGATSNLSGGAVGSAPYQSAANTTAFVGSPITSAHTFFYGWQPSGSIIAPIAIDLGTYLTAPADIGQTTPGLGRFSTLSTTANGLSFTSSSTTILSGSQWAITGNASGASTILLDNSNSAGLSSFQFQDNTNAAKGRIGYHNGSAANLPGDMVLEAFSVPICLSQGGAACAVNIGTTAPTNSIATNASGPILLVAQIPAGRKGTLTCTSGGTITVTNSNYIATSDVTFTNKTPGGTVSWTPNINGTTPGTGFTVVCATLDTSVYTYSIWN